MYTCTFDVWLNAIPDEDVTYKLFFFEEDQRLANIDDYDSDPEEYFNTCFDEEEKITNL